MKKAKKKSRRKAKTFTVDFTPAGLYHSMIYSDDLLERVAAAFALRELHGWPGFRFASLREDKT